MPIRIECPSCGKMLQAPDNLAGKRVKCAGCQAVLTVPEPVLDAHESDVAIPLPVKSSASAAAEAADGDRIPCSMCGEMIPRMAAKCRFCGEIFDADLKKIEKKKSKRNNDLDADMTTGDWVAAILCSGIGCIAGVIWMIQGKPKGLKMVGISFAASCFWAVVRLAAEASLKR